MRGWRLAEWGLAHTYKGPLQQRRVNDIMISGEKLMGWSRSVVCK